MARLRGTWLLSASAAQLISAIAGFLTNLVYARTLQPADVGFIALVNSVAMIWAVFLDRGLGSWMTREVAAGTVTLQRSLQIALRAAIPGVAVLFAFSIVGSYVQPLLRLDLRLALVLVPMVLSFWVYSLSISLSQGANRSSIRAIAITLNGILTLGFTVLLALFCQDPIVFILGSAIAYLAVGIGLAIVCVRGSSKVVNPVAYSGALRAASPLFGSNLVTYLTSVGDIVLLSIFAPAADVGRYQVAKKLAQAVTLPLGAGLSVALGRMSARPMVERGVLAGKIGALASAAFLGTIVGTAIFGPALIPSVFGSSYADLTALVLILMVASQVQFLRDLFTALAVSNGRFTTAFRVNLGGLILLLLGTGSVVGFSGELAPPALALLLILSYSAAFVAHLLIARARRELTRGGFWLPLGLLLLLLAVSGLAISFFI
ncbi:MAG: oligosaccharide flippase family protein [Rhodoglobus sp.]